MARVASGLTVPDFVVGQVATQTVIAPIPLVVIDPEETALLKQREAQKVQVICRYYTNAADEVEEAFRNAFAQTRSNFLNRVQGVFNARRIDAAKAVTMRFTRLAENFQKQNRSFPMDPDLAAVWAQGLSDRVIQSSLTARLRESMTAPIRSAGQLPPEMRFGPMVRLVPVSDSEETVTLQTVDRRGYAVPRTNVLTLLRARELLAASFPEEQRALVKFLSGLLQPNCFPDQPLTLQARERRTQSLWSAQRYEPGQPIVKEGEIVDRKVKAALEALREKLAIVTLQQEIQSGRAAARPLLQREAIFAACAAVALIAGAVVAWRLLRRKSSNSLLPARLPDGAPATVVACPSCAENIVVPEPARLRGVHLAGLLKDKVVAALVWKQKGMMDTQQQAAADIAELEARLEKVHAPLQERVRAYEQRILELEKELAQKGEENRELIKAKIRLVKSQMSLAKEKVELN